MSVGNIIDKWALTITHFINGNKLSNVTIFIVCVGSLVVKVGRVGKVLGSVYKVWVILVILIKNEMKAGICIIGC